MDLNVELHSEILQLRNQLSTARNEINNLRQQLKSLKYSHQKDCDNIRKELNEWKCPQCCGKQLNENASASSLGGKRPQSDLCLNYIGTIRTHFPEKRGTPRQPGICSDMIAKLILDSNVFTNPSHALADLQEYSHMWILYHFHKNDAKHVRAKVAPPRLNGLRTGVFATRSPHRPTPIGLSLVKIDRIAENTIYFSGVDMIDNTPVVDIKPYIPQYDNPNLNVGAVVEARPGQGYAPYSQAQDHAHQIANTSRLDDDHPHEDFHLTSPSVRMMDGEENGEEREMVGAVATVVSVEESRPISRIGEREAPDGEEEDSGQAVSGIAPNPQVQIRVPNWIDNPPVSILTVHFKQRAFLHLQQMGNEGDIKKTQITNVLREDPRSVYLRERVENTNYVFRIADLYVSCRFDDSTHTVTVFQVFQDGLLLSDD